MYYSYCCCCCFHNVSLRFDNSDLVITAIKSHRISECESEREKARERERERRRVWSPQGTRVCGGHILDVEKPALPWELPDIRMYTANNVYTSGGR